MKAHIWYDAAGVILAVGHIPGRVDASDASRRHAIALALQGQHVLDAEVPSDALPELHSTHRVDVFRRALLAQPRAAE